MYIKSDNEDKNSWISQLFSQVIANNSSVLTIYSTYNDSNDKIYYYIHHLSESIISISLSISIPRHLVPESRFEPENPIFSSGPDNFFKNIDSEPI